jgi:hypothetical protein
VIDTGYWKANPGGWRPGNYIGAPPMAKICDCEDVISSTMSHIADILTGKDGNLCDRWLELDISQTMEKTWNPSSFFLYPTPRLKSLELYWVSMRTIGWVRGQFLPFMPSLETVILDHCEISGIPDISTAKDVYIYYLDGVTENCDMTNLCNAMQIQRLGLEMPPEAAEYKLPNELPLLTFLHIGLEGFPTNMEQVSIPNIRELSLGFALQADFPNHVRTLVKCPKIPLNQLQILKIAIFEDEYPLVDDFEFREAY